MSRKKIFIIFLIWRLIDFLIIYFSPKFIPYLGFFPYKDQLPFFHLPEWISSLANFDGLHYILIAKNGYSQFEQAFFPLYPLLIKYLSSLFFNNQLLTGLIISNISFLLGLLIFFKLFKSEARSTKSEINSNYKIFKFKNYFEFRISNFEFWLIIFILIFPTSFFFGAVYTEGLFFLLIISTLYFLKKEKHLLVIIFSFLASLTRLIGVFLIIPIIFQLIQQSKIKNQNDKSKLKNITLFMLILSPIIGLGVYCFYLWKTTGNPLFFLTSQPIFGANRSSHLIFLPQVYWRYFKIFFTAAFDSRYFVSVIEFLIFNFVFVILALDLNNLKNRWREEKLKINSRQNLFFWISINLFSFINLLLPTLTGTFSSIPRYSLLSISFFIYLAKIKNNFVKIIILIVFTVLHITLLGLFRQGYFIS